MSGDDFLIRSLRNPASDYKRMNDAVESSLDEPESD